MLIRKRLSAAEAKTLKVHDIDFIYNRRPV